MVLRHAENLKIAQSFGQTDVERDFSKVHLPPYSKSTTLFLFHSSSIGGTLRLEKKKEDRFDLLPGHSEYNQVQPTVSEEAYLVAMDCLISIERLLFSFLARL